MVRELWNDPVWSKVIAALITTAVLAVVAEIMRRVSPGTLTRLVSRWQGEIRGVVIATAIYAVIWVAVAVLRSNPARVPEATTSTPQIEATPTDSRSPPTPTDSHFTLHKGLAFIEGFSNLRGRCLITVTAPPETRDIAKKLLELFQYPNSLITASGEDDDLTFWHAAGYMIFNTTPYFLTGFPVDRFNGFQIIPTQEQPAEPSPDADVTPSPTPQPMVFPSTGVVIHAEQFSKDTRYNADRLAELLDGLGFDVHHGSELPADASLNVDRSALIYIQLGHNPWKAR
jgi:hypothetical protein